MAKSDFIEEIFWYQSIYDEAYKDQGYARIIVIPVEDEDHYDQDPDVQHAIRDGFKVLEINAFGEGGELYGAMVVLGLKP